MRIYNKTHVYAVDLLDLANYLEANGRTDAVKRWNSVKKQITDNGYIMKQGFNFEFDYDYQKEYEDMDEETLKDILFIQKELEVPDKSVLHLKIKSEYLLRNDLEKIKNYALKPTVESMQFINVIFVMDDLENLRKGFKERWEQIIGWHSMNFSNYSMIYFDFDIKEFEKQNTDFVLDARLFQKEYELKDKEKIAFQINW